MATRRRQRRFDAEAYWASRPYCSVCAKRKTRDGHICYECRRAGHTSPPPKTAPTPPQSERPRVVPAKSSAQQHTPQQSTTNPKPKENTSAFWIVAAICVVIGLFVVSSQDRPARSTYTPTPLQRRASQNGDVYVRGYYRSDGTYVRPHVRTQQNHIFRDNYSSSGNRNPYTGKSGTRKTPSRGSFYFDAPAR